jgi:hypothetical protein
VSPYTYNTSSELMSTPNISYTYDNNGSALTKTDGTHHLAKNARIIGRVNCAIETECEPNDFQRFGIRWWYRAGFGKAR